MLSLPIMSLLRSIMAYPFGAILQMAIRFGNALAKASSASDAPIKLERKNLSNNIFVYNLLFAVYATKQF